MFGRRSPEGTALRKELQYSLLIKVKTDVSYKDIADDAKHIKLTERPYEYKRKNDWMNAG